ncbi:hypothetical protein Pmani_019781 [Petrolisthes manimaculis]|uniref:Uncharacterized protein n=1 Tax=Petrolisthes manimaculis TaxID=1843537 RepID=A0AAE1U3P0_9EUCA|nr:hypothetical protein Pmani_019781 [Petrolisthes manimaculis]
MPQLCRECGGSSFTVEMGVKMCNQCGMEQRGYMELQSQESMGCIDTSRMIFAKRPIEEDNSEDEDKDKDEPGEDSFECEEDKKLDETFDELRIIESWYNTIFHQKWGYESGRCCSELDLVPPGLMATIPK